MNIVDKIKKDTVTFGLVSASLLFFIYKGISYFLLGSYVPIIFIAIVLIVLLISFNLSAKSQKTILKFWAIFLIIWGLGRLTIWLAFQIASDLTESHMRDQLGLFQNIFSIAMALAGFVVFKRLNKNVTPRIGD